VTAAAAPAAATDVPPMIVTIVPAVDLSPQLLKAVLAEAAAIWRPGGVSFVWRHAPRAVSPARLGDPAPYMPSTLRITIGDDHGVGQEGRLPLGWVVFNEGSVPVPEIYLSLANAKAMMEAARGVIGIVDQMPVAQRETLLSRAMGRALAHELGHYLLASKLHTPRGLMKASLTAVELFTPNGGLFRIEPAQRRAVADRLRGGTLTASR
jgi:hypothetical protein